MVAERASAFLGIVSPKGDLFARPFFLLATLCIPKTASRKKSTEGNECVTGKAALSPETASGCEAAGVGNRSRPVDRWISRDPLEEDDGPNLYAYVQNDPVNYWDPDGTTSVVARACLVAMAKAAANRAAKNAGKGKPPSITPKPPNRSKNRLPDEGPPNTTVTNKPETSAKKYGPDGKTTKEANKGHSGDKTPPNEKGPHIHDHKPNPNHPDGMPTRQPGRPPEPGEWEEFFP